MIDFLGVFSLPEGLKVSWVSSLASKGTFVRCSLVRVKPCLRSILLNVFLVSSNFSVTRIGSLDWCNSGREKLLFCEVYILLGKRLLISTDVEVVIGFPNTTFWGVNERTDCGSACLTDELIICACGLGLSPRLTTTRCGNTGGCWITWKFCWRCSFSTRPFNTENFTVSICPISPAISPKTFSLIWISLRWF